MKPNKLLIPLLKRLQATPRNSEYRPSKQVSAAKITSMSDENDDLSIF
jgi:hypothetical protein